MCISSIAAFAGSQRAALAGACEPLLLQLRHEPLRVGERRRREDEAGQRQGLRARARRPGVYGRGERSRCFYRLGATGVQTQQLLNYHYGCTL